ncbi:tetratricopeptide repeat protein [Haliangium ochraceum]|uniref:Tetratricopeptide repeat protein n=1 Tax=Haliangium ochraceum (strain DSM 14365 / JCM 11303 / SMP-2) TaxID=502025 RepID=D0LJ56_HALO1|nr:tetratricopeptide repeat protein [Haliangium ochraceum]ACY14903.1 hypothetical protein Hoch_2365 [Haliangium ochraceum DSM 14365]
MRDSAEFKRTGGDDEDGVERGFQGEGADWDAESGAGSGAPPTLEDLAGDVARLRLRLDEQAAMQRRTHQAVVGLAESVGKLVTQQRRRERGMSLNSFVAYMLFTLLLGGGFFMLYSTRAGDLVSARDAAVSERDAARERAQALEEDLGARADSEQSLLSFYQLVRDGRHAEVVAGYPEVEREQLSATEAAVFANAVEQSRNELVDAGYLAGLDAYRGARYDDAATSLSAALGYEDNGPRAAQMRYYLGMSQFHQGAHEEAARQLELAMAGQVEKQGAADVRYYLASALDRMGEAARARAEYERFAADYPRLPLSWTARRRATQLGRRSGATN